MLITEIKDKLKALREELSLLVEPTKSVKDLNEKMENEIRMAESRNQSEFDSKESLKENKEKALYDEKLQKEIDSIERESVSGFQGLDKINEVLEDMKNGYSRIIEDDNFGVVFEEEDVLLKQLESYSNYYSEGNYESKVIDFSNMKNISIALLVLMLIAGRIISPIIAVLLVVISIIVLVMARVEGKRYKNTFILKNTIEKKNLEISEINIIKEKEYNNKIAKIKDKIGEFIFIPDNYVPFDSTKLKARYELQLRDIKNEYLTKLDMYDEDHLRLSNRIKELEEELKLEEGKLVSGIYSYDPENLLKIYDLDFPINEELDMFCENEKSSLIVYESRDEMVEMLQMTIFQICKYMHPTVIEINIVDLMNICQDFVMFELPFVNLITNNEELQKYIVKEDIAIQEDTKKVLKISDNINEYNTLKLSEGSVPVKYKFTFVYEANEGFLKSDLLVRALRNGSKTGHIFMLAFEMNKFLSTPEVDSEYLTLFKESENTFSYFDKKLVLDKTIHMNFNFKD